MNPENPLTAKSRSAKSKEGTRRGRQSVVEKNREEPQARGGNSRKSCAQELMENTSPHRAVGEKHEVTPVNSQHIAKSEYSASAAAAAKSRQSCPTLCDPIDGSPPGSPSLEFSSKNTGVGCHFLLQCIKVKGKSLSRVRPSAAPWTAAHQAPPCMGFSRQEYWSGVPLPSPYSASDAPYLVYSQDSLGGP